MSFSSPVIFSLVSSGVSLGNPLMSCGTCSSVVIESLGSPGDVFRLFLSSNLVSLCSP